MVASWSAGEVESIAGDNQTAASPLAHSQGAGETLAEGEGIVSQRELLGSVHPMGTQEVALVHFLFAQRASQRGVRDHPAAAKPGGNLRGSQSRRSRAETHIALGRENAHRWRRRCAFADEVFRQGTATECSVSWRWPLWMKSSLFCLFSKVQLAMNRPAWRSCSGTIPRPGEYHDYHQDSCCRRRSGV